MLSLLGNATHFWCWAGIGLVVASAAGAAFADDPGSNDKPSKPPAQSASIELELRPSAPEAIEPPKSSDASQPKTDPPSLELSASRSSREKSVQQGSLIPAKEKPLELNRRTTEPPLADKKSEITAEKEKTPAKLKTQPTQELKRDVKPKDLLPLRSSASSVKLSDGQIDRDFSNERLDSDEIATSEMTGEPDDLPLDQSEHPFDAPAAQPTERKSITQKPSAQRGAVPLSTPAIDFLQYAP